MATGSDDVLYAILVAFLLALMFLSSGWLVMGLLAVFFGQDD